MIDEMPHILRNIRRRMRKRVKGMTRSVFDRIVPYDEHCFWDSEFYERIEGDNDTIGSQVDRMTSAYHYASTEAALIMAISRYGNDDVRNLLDIGSGTGHCTDFFIRLFPELERADLFDVSTKSCQFLRKKYERDSRVSIHNASADALPSGTSYDLACLIGCAFHIVGDDQLQSVLQRISDSLAPDGLIVLNDLLPWISYANQFTREGNVSKRVRSKRMWRTLAAASGLRARFVRSYAWLRAPGSIPEGHLVWLQRC